MLRFLFSFSGRLARAQYWRAFVLLGAFGLALFVLLFGTMFVMRQAPPLAVWVIYVAGIISLVVSWFAINVKRAHDLGEVGVRLFAPLRAFEIPFREGQPHENAFGPPPGDGWH
jgi:uncharacterized membrane protein YhaH (DUF805 family)